MPIIGYPVRGAHHDTTTIKETICNLSKLNIKKITMVWDRGFVSEKNIQLAIYNKMHILSAGVQTNNDVMDWISKYSDSSDYSPDQLIKEIVFLIKILTSNK